MPEEPNTQPGTPPERPIFNSEALKEKHAKKEGIKEKIDTLNETLAAIEEAKKEALEDIKTDIAKVYPDETPEGETKRAQEYKAVEKMLSRLEAGYIQAAKESKAEIKPGDEALYEFNNLIDEYFKELQTITGDTNPEEGKIDFSTVDPYEFWKNTAGWYEKVEDEKAPGTESFKENRIEEEGARWQDAIRTFQALDKKGNPTNRIKEGEEENFQNWIEAHREDLRRVILRQIADRKYIIDFANLTGIENPTKEDIDAAIADSASKASFIAKNIGLADLFADISQAITVWKGDKLYTGQINTDYNRKNGLKGGYFYNDGKNHYLEIWHGAVISTNPADQIAEDKKDLLPNDMFEEPKEETTPRDPSSFPVEQQPKGKQVINLIYKPTENVQTVGPERAKLIKASVEKRKQILTPDGKNTFEIEYKYEKLYGGDTITTPGKTTFELQEPQPEFTDVNAELVYASKEFPNVEITIPYNKDNSFLLRVKSNKEEKDYPRATIYEFENFEALKQKLGEEIGKPEVVNKQSGKLQNNEIPVVELDESCSEKTVDKYLNNIDKDSFYPLVVSKPGKVIVHSEVKGDNVKVEGKIGEKKTKLTDSDLTPEGIDKLPIEETTEELDLSSCDVTKESLEKLLAKAPKVKKISFNHSKLNPGDKILSIVADKLNGTLEELDLTGTAYDTKDLQYLQSCPKLATLKLGSSELTGDFEIETYVSKLVNLKSLTLASTSITDKSIESLSRLVNLTFLDLSGTNISHKGIQALRKNLPNCKITESKKSTEKLLEIKKENYLKMIRTANDFSSSKDGLTRLGERDDGTTDNLEDQSFRADIFYDNQKVGIIKVGDPPMTAIDARTNKDIPLEKLLELIAKKKNLSYKESDGLEKIEVFEGEKKLAQININAKFYNESGEETPIQKIKEIVEGIKKEKEGKEYIENLFKDHGTLARVAIKKFFGDKGSFVDFKTSEISRDKNTIRGKLSYRGEPIGGMDIRITDAKKKITATFLLDDNGGETDQAFMLTKMNDIDTRKKAEEDARAAQEAVAKLNKQKKETIEALNGILKNIDKNLKISDSTTKDSTVEQGRKYFDLQIVYFGETIGKILPWADVEFKDQVDTDIWVELETDESFEQIKEGNLQKRLEKLKEKALEKRRDKKIEEFKKTIEEANKEIFGGYYGDRLFLDIEELEKIKYSTSQKKPYIKAKIYFKETYADPTGMGESTPVTKHIGYIDDWIISESEMGISDKNEETVTEGTMIIEKLKKLKEED